MLNFDSRENTMNNLLSQLGDTPKLTLKGFLPMQTLSKKYKHLQCLSYNNDNVVAGVFCIWGGDNSTDPHAIIATYDTRDWHMKHWAKLPLNHGNDITYDHVRKMWIITEMDKKKNYRSVVFVNDNLEIVKIQKLDFPCYSICYNYDKNEFGIASDTGIVVTNSDFKMIKIIPYCSDSNKFCLQTVEYADGFYYENRDNRIFVYIENIGRHVKTLKFINYEQEALCYLNDGTFLLSAVSNKSDDLISIAHIYEMDIKSTDNGKELIPGKKINGYTQQNVYYTNEVCIENNQVDLTCAEKYRNTARYGNNSNNPFNVTRKILGRDANALQNIEVTDNGRCLTIHSVFDSFQNDNGQLQTERIYFNDLAKKRGITARTSFDSNGYHIRLYKNNQNINMREESGIQFKFSLRYAIKALTTVVR